MPTEGRTPLTPEQADLIRGIDDSQAEMNGFLDTLQTTRDIDQRLRAMAASYFEIGYMLLVKAVANPERLVIKPPKDG